MKAIRSIGIIALVVAACVALTINLVSAVEGRDFSHILEVVEELYFSALLLIPYIILLAFSLGLWRVRQSALDSIVICAVSLLVMAYTFYVYLYANLSLSYIDERGRLTYTFAVMLGGLLLIVGIGLMSLGLLMSRLWYRSRGRAA